MVAIDTAGLAIVIADDHALVRAGLQRIVESEPGLRVTGQANDGPDTLARLADTRCDVLLLDLDMPAPSGLELIKRVRAQWPQLSIVVVSMHNQPQMVRAALAAGADDYVAKDSDPEVLIAALRRTAGAGGPTCAN
jgi:DNA-binding NarL/FixJ family response regulator